MKLQPFQAQKVPINVKNGGTGGRTQIIFAPKHANQARQVFNDFRKCTKQLDGTSMAMDIDSNDSSVWQSNTTSYSAKMEAMLQDDAMSEFLPLTPPPKAGRRTSGPKLKKPKKKKAKPPESETDSDEDTRQECQKKAKKKNAKKKSKVLTQSTYTNVLLDNEISSTSKSSTASSELKLMFKSLMLD